MSHRRLVQLLALTVSLAFLALLGYTAPARPATIRLAAVRSGPSMAPLAIAAADGAVAKMAADAQFIDAVDGCVGDCPPPPAPGSDGEPDPEPRGTGDASAAIARWFGDRYDSAYRVADCESTLNPAAVSAGGGNWGLFQINTTHEATFEEVTGHPWADVLDADVNAQFARWLYDQSGGWGPWACRWAA